MFFFIVNWCIRIVPLTTGFCFQSFAKEAREQCDVMQNMLKKMESLYTDLSEYYVFDKQKYTLEEFFTDLKTFKDSFLVKIFVFDVSCKRKKCFVLTGSEKG